MSETDNQKEDQAQPSLTDDSSATISVAPYVLADSNSHSIDPADADPNKLTTEIDTHVANEINRKTRRSLLTGGLAAVASLAGWQWLRTQTDVGGVQWPFRRGFEINERIWSSYYKDTRLAPNFPPAMVKEPRINGWEGMSDDFDPQEWELSLYGLANGPGKNRDADSLMRPANFIQIADANNAPAANPKSKANKEIDSKLEDEDPADLTLSIEDIKALPRVELVTELKCIEGWSVIVHWAGARFVDLLNKYPPMTRDNSRADVINNPQNLVRYVSLETPDGGYYVGLDMKSALHPQTLLCYEMNNRPLTLDHGAPLRLVIPIKYGIKSIKRIGAIRFTDEKPADYWAEQGYDWYAGH